MALQQYRVNAGKGSSASKICLIAFLPQSGIPKRSLLCFELIRCFAF